MALYTGVNAYTDVKVASKEAIIKVEFYHTYLAYLKKNESYGGYPTFEYVLDFLAMDGDVEDTEANYEKYHQLYVKEMGQIEFVVAEIDKYNLLDKVRREELLFVRRNYELAQAFRGYLKLEDVYFRKLVTYDDLVELATASDAIHDMTWVLKLASEYADTHVFEIHVT